MTYLDHKIKKTLTLINMQYDNNTLEEIATYVTKNIDQLDKIFEPFIINFDEVISDNICYSPAELYRSEFYHVKADIPCTDLFDFTNTRQQNLIRLNK